MSVVFFLTNYYPIHPRLKKLSNKEDYFGFQKKFLAWNRGKRKSDSKFIFNNPIGYNQPIKKLFSFPRFMIHCFKCFRKAQPKIVVCRYWDMLAVAVLLKPFFRFKIHYDVNDLPYDNIQKFEKFALKYTDRVYLASRFFYNYYDKYNLNIELFENKVDVNLLAEPTQPFEFKGCDDNGIIRVCFIGGIRYYSVFERVLLAWNDLPVVALHKLEFHFFGDGIDYNKVRELVKKHSIPNVYFYGRYTYSQIPMIYDFSTIVWAVYDSKVTNVKAAISNKFFESLYFNKPSCYSKYTQLGKLVEEKKVGFAIDEKDIEGIKSFFVTLAQNPEVIKDMLDHIVVYKRCEDVEY